MRLTCYLTMLYSNYQGNFRGTCVPAKAINRLIRDSAIPSTPVSFSSHRTLVHTSYRNAHRSCRRGLIPAATLRSILSLVQGRVPSGTVFPSRTQIVLLTSRRPCPLREDAFGQHPLRVPQFCKRQPPAGHLPCSASPSVPSALHSRALLPRGMPQVLLQ